MSVLPETSAKEQLLLKRLVEQYILDGTPVGSKTLADSPELNVSSATIRNVMADLEAKGYVASPHTSAGRIPTQQGYRLFVDNLLTIKPEDRVDITQASHQFDPDMTAQELVESASGILSEVTQLAGLVTIPKRDRAVLRHLEFLPMSDKRVLVILVLDDHEVQNRVIETISEYSEVQLREAANYLNRSFVGQDVTQIRRRLIESMQNDRDNMNSLMSLAIEMAERSLPDDSEGSEDYVLAGQENLLDIGSNTAVDDLRALFQAFSTKSDILDLLDRSMETEGIQLFIGQESGYQILDECSVVTSAYRIEGQQVGVLGVVGPTRMPYQRIIPAVDVTARLLSAALGGLRSKKSD